MLYMVCYWIKIREETKEGGTIIAATYPTALAYMLIMDVSRYLMIPCTPHFDLKYLIECGFIRKVLDNIHLESDIYLWKQEYMCDMCFLIYAPISFCCRESSRFEVINISSDGE
jgi:hypothetical protein